MAQRCLPSIQELASFAFLLFVLQSSHRLRVGPVSAIIICLAKAFKAIWIRRPLLAARSLDWTMWFSLVLQG